MTDTGGLDAGGGTAAPRHGAPAAAGYGACASGPRPTAASSRPVRAAGRLAGPPQPAADLCGAEMTLRRSAGRRPGADANGLSDGDREPARHGGRRRGLQRPRGDRGGAVDGARRGADGRTDARDGRGGGDAPDHRRREPARIIILTTFDLDEYVYAALRAGASGFLLKDSPPAELLSAIRAVAVEMRSSPRASPAGCCRRSRIGCRRPAAGTGAPRRLDSLTAREHEVLIESPAVSPTPRSPSAWSCPRRP